MIRLKNPLSAFAASPDEPRSRESWRVLLVTLLLSTLVWSVIPRQFNASDPSWYSAEAAIMAGGYDFPPGHALEQQSSARQNHLFNHRYGLILPTAALYKLFGINLHTLTGVLLLAMLIITISIWAVMPDERTRRMSLLICLLSVPLWKSSIFLYPDLVVTAFMVASSLCLFSRERVLRAETTTRLRGLAVFGMLLLFYAFLSKLSAYWVLPLWVWALIKDGYGPDRRPLLLGFWMPAMLTGLVLGIGYLVAMYIIWGDPWARFEAIESARHLWAGRIANDRLTTGPIKPFINLIGHWGLLPLAGIGLLLAPSRLRPWIGYLICCLGFYWFGSASLERYQPLPLTIPRMMLPAVPAVLIFAAFLIGRFSSKIIGLLIIILISGAPFYKWMKAREVSQNDAQIMVSIVQESIAENPNILHLLICSENRTCGTEFSFYTEYGGSDNFKAIYAGDLKNLSIKGEPVIFAHLFSGREQFLQGAYGSKPYRRELTSLPGKVVYERSGRKLIRIEANKAQLLEALFPE